MKTILVACIVASSLFAAAGTAWATNASFERGTSWTASGDAMTWDGPIGTSWERLGF